MSGKAHHWESDLNRHGSSHQPDQSFSALFQRHFQNHLLSRFNKLKATEVPHLLAFNTFPLCKDSIRFPKMHCLQMLSLNNCKTFLLKYLHSICIAQTRVGQQIGLHDTNPLSIFMLFSQTTWRVKQNQALNSNPILSNSEAHLGFDILVNKTIILPIAHSTNTAFFKRLPFRDFV